MKVPVEIRGAGVRFLDREGRAEFTGGVTVLRGTSTLTADSLQTIRGPNEAAVRGHVVFADAARGVRMTCDEARYAHGLRHILARGHCALTLGSGAESSTVTSDEMELFVDAREALAHGGVRIVQGENEARSADAHLLGAESRVILTGAPVLRRAPHEFACVRADYDLKSRITVLQGPVSGRLHSGRLNVLRGEPGR